jgi:hypothetical protein
MPLYIRYSILPNPSQSDSLISIRVSTRMQAPARSLARHNPKKIKLNILYHLLRLPVSVLQSLRRTGHLGYIL